MKIIWTQYALNDLQAIRSYLKQSESLGYAKKIIQEILDEVKSLKEWHTKGTFIHELEDLHLTTYRQLLAGQNRIIIECGQDVVYVHLVAHTSRNLEALIRRRLMSPQAISTVSAPSCANRNKTGSKERNAPPVARHHTNAQPKNTPKHPPTELILGNQRERQGERSPGVRRNARPRHGELKKNTRED